MDTPGPRDIHNFRGHDVQGKCQNGNMHGYVGTGFLRPSEDEHFIVWL